jgi:hypothetical protein
MNRSFKAVGELNAVSMAAIDRRTDDHSDGIGGMRDSIAGGHDVFLGNDLSARGINQRLIVSELQRFEFL